MKITIVERSAIDNSGIALSGLTSFGDTFVQGSTIGLRMNISAKVPRHGKPQKRYGQCICNM